MFELLFWILLAIILYTYVGYTVLLRIVSFFVKRHNYLEISDENLPDVTLLIAVYNEKEILEEKIANTLALIYPPEKLKLLWVTDGSDDGSVELLQKQERFEVLHSPIRKGKTAALNRAMPFVKTPITLFTDANTLLSPNAVRLIVSRFANRKTGCVAGEKRIIPLKADAAAGAGEGIYWNYESLIKRLESLVGSVQGAAGEIYAIRTELFTAPPEDFVLDDFLVTMSIAQQGYKIDYEPLAIATETSSLSIAEELKRKIRIAAGGFQVLFSYSRFLNFTSHFFLSLQYFSHKVLRWIFVPFALLPVFVLNIILCYKNPQNQTYIALLAVQSIFYLAALAGNFLRENRVRYKFLFAPYYLCLMNYAVILGFFRYISKNQKAAWEKSKRNTGK